MSPRPLLGTFHCKFMIVDRKVALVNSNNIQDRANMEMMVHLEGPIVDSLYDTALISWFRPMHSRLPLLNRPFEMPEGGYKFGMENECASMHLLDGKEGAKLYHNLGNEKIPPDASLDGKIFVSGRYQTVTEHLSWSSPIFARVRALIVWFQMQIINLTHTGPSNMNRPNHPTMSICLTLFTHHTRNVRWFS